MVHGHARLRGLWSRLRVGDLQEEGVEVHVFVQLGRVGHRRPLEDVGLGDTRQQMRRTTARTPRHETGGNAMGIHRGEPTLDVVVESLFWIG